MSSVQWVEATGPSRHPRTAGPDMPGPRYLGTATLMPDGRVLVAGGDDGVKALDSALLLDTGKGG